MLFNNTFTPILYPFNQVNECQILNYGVSSYIKIKYKWLIA